MIVFNRLCYFVKVTHVARSEAMCSVNVAKIQCARTLKRTSIVVSRLVNGMSTIDLVR